MLLATGAVPLDVMEPRMRAWIVAQQTNSEQATSEQAK